MRGVCARRGARAARKGGIKTHHGVLPSGKGAQAVAVEDLDFARLKALHGVRARVDEALVGAAAGAHAHAAARVI